MGGEGMMYYRRKILLALLDLFGGHSGKTDLQKLLFIVSKKQENPSYEFVPYKFGAYSFQLQQDLNTLTKYGFVAETDKGWNLEKSDYSIRNLSKSDKEILEEVKKDFKDQLGEKLIRYTYIHFPFYAIYSEIALKILSRKEMALVEQEKTNSISDCLATIGYEGRTIEKYVEILIRNGIRVLCDIRKNPLSMKFGFSKKQLSNILKMSNIEYVHIPGLGIESEQRKSLHSKSDYNELFEHYKKTTLKENTSDLDLLVQIYREKKRIALTCFEADINSCHRKHTSEKLHKILEINSPVVHL